MLENSQTPNGKGTLLEPILEDFFMDNLFEPISNLHLLLQDKLDSTLEFETKVSSIQSKGDVRFGGIYLPDERRVYNFSIVVNNIPKNNY